MMYQRFSKKVISAITGILLSSFIYSQPCPTSAVNPWEWPSHSNWFFGNGNIGKFSGGLFTVSTKANVTSYEGTSGASDDKGNLLFFTNGRLLWDASGSLKYSGILEGNEGFMDNGSASQGVITIRHPLDPDNYYIFSVDDANQGVSNGLNYFVFDKNGNLKSGPARLGSYRTSEGITATRHYNGVDIWLTVYASGTTNFYTYLITCTGVISTPVISPVAPNFSGQKERGGLAFSWNGKYFAQAHPDYTPDSDKEVTVYLFDNKTGIISDPHHISDASSGESPYDVIFSPDNSKLYISTAIGTLGYYDVSSWNSGTMSASYKLIPGVSTGSHSAIEIGGDGSLYMATLSMGLGKLSGNMNNGLLTYSNIANAVSCRGLPTMYLPPQEEPDIKEAGPFCTTDPPVNLSTTWICTGLNAEDSITPLNTYSGKGITHAANGVFDPSVAGIGTHMIIFKRCNVDDTIFIAVKACICPDTSLKSILPICANESINLDAYKITTETGTWSITSAPPGSTATIAGSIFSSNNTIAGSYVIRFTLNKIIPGCPLYAERTIIIKTVPVVSVTGATICAGKPAQLEASGGNAYLWSSGNTGASITVYPTSTTTYTVTGTSSGCTNTARAIVVVHPSPFITSDAVNICPGDTATLKANGAFTYSWSDGQTGSSIKVMPTGTNTYTVTGTSTEGCANTITVTVTVGPLITNAGRDQSICEGQSATLTATGGSSFIWSPPDGLSTTTGKTVVATPKITTTYTVTASTSSRCTATDKVTVEVNPIPVVQFAPFAKGCKPVCVNFIDSSKVTPGTIIRWFWNLGDGNTSAVKNPKHCYDKAGSYHVTLTVISEKGCTQTKTINDIVTVLSLPAADFLASPQPTSIFNPKIFFKDLSAGDPVSWEWTFWDHMKDSIVNTSSQHLEYTYSDTGTYKVRLVITNKYGCKDTMIKYVVIRPEWSFYIPNTFTPNDDGKNEGFIGKSWNVIEHQMWIFDRWGNMIYTTGKTKDPESAVPWDGKANSGTDIAQIDTYVWLVILKDVFGKNHRYTGHVNIIK